MPAYKAKTSVIINPDFFDELIIFISNIEGQDELRDFFIGILSPSEIRHICNRLQIIVLLRYGWSHQEIAKILSVGIATVSRASREINNDHFAYLDPYIFGKLL